jgi:hypothetical protein
MTKNKWRTFCGKSVSHFVADGKLVRQWNR